MATNQTIVLDTPEQISAAQIIALKGALRLECRGMKRRGRSAFTILKEMGLVTGNNKQHALDQITEYVDREILKR